MQQVGKCILMILVFLKMILKMFLLLENLVGKNGLCLLENQLDVLRLQDLLLHQLDVLHQLDLLHLDVGFIDLLLYQLDVLRLQDLILYQLDVLRLQDLLLYLLLDIMLDFEKLELEEIMQKQTVLWLIMAYVKAHSLVDS